MNIKIIIKELEEIIEKLKIKIIGYETDNRELRKKIKEMKEYILLH